MNNIPVVKIGIVAVSRDCFPESLAVNRRKALVEAYKAVNADADIELQESDSTSGMTAAMDGTCDIGMASRELKDSETAGGLTSAVIAKDGIVVIVNKDNTVSDLTPAQVNDIFRGNVTDWSEVQ